MDDREKRTRIWRPASDEPRGRDCPRSFAHKPFSRRYSPIIHHQSSFISSPGFTLIELLVVIAVIVLLIAMLMPALQRAKRQAKAVVCRAQLKQWAQVVAIYLDDNAGRLPSGQGAAAVALLRGPLPTEEDPKNPKLYQPTYAKGMACCPMASRATTDACVATFSTIPRMGLPDPDSLGWQVQVHPGSTFEAWETIHPRPTFRASYGFNEWAVRAGSRDITRSVHAFSLRGRASIPLILDSTLPVGGLTPISDDPPSPENRSMNVAAVCIDRHDGYVNSSFMDWSVRRVGLKELWILKWTDDYSTGGRWTTRGGVEPEDWPEWMRDFKDY